MGGVIEGLNIEIKLNTKKLLLWSYLFSMFFYIVVGSVT
jgi:hypothetical protein